MRYVIVAMALSVMCSTAYSQDPRTYVSMAGELNFSFATISPEVGGEENGEFRFAPWFNLQILKNYDGSKIGTFFGFTLRNIGFIFQKGDEKWKVRNYAAGVPVGLKIGNMNGAFVYAGYEFEAPFHYKEKYFFEGDKDRSANIWLSKRVSPFTHSAFLGYHFRGGFNIKLKYYITEFFNPDFDVSSVDDERDIRYPGKGKEGDSDYVPQRPYLKVNIFYIALTWNMFKKPRPSTSPPAMKETEQLY